MTWALIALKFVKRYYKTIGVAVVLGTIIAGVATLYGAWQIERGLRISLSAKLEAAKIEAKSDEKIFEEAIGDCLEANQHWQDVLDDWRRQANEMRRRAESYGARIKDLELVHSEIEWERNELEARIAGMTATDCPGAVDELIDVLGWGMQ